MGVELDSRVDARASCSLRHTEFGTTVDTELVDSLSSLADVKHFDGHLHESDTSPNGPRGTGGYTLYSYALTATVLLNCFCFSGVYFLLLQLIETSGANGGGADATGTEGSAAASGIIGGSLASEGGLSDGGSAPRDASVTQSQEQLQPETGFQNGSQALAAVYGELGLGEKDVKSQPRAQPGSGEEETSSLDAALAQVRAI